MKQWWTPKKSRLNYKTGFGFNRQKELESTLLVYYLGDIIIHSERFASARSILYAVIRLSKIKAEHESLVCHLLCEIFPAVYRVVVPVNQRPVSTAYCVALYGETVGYNIVNFVKMHKCGEFSVILPVSLRYTRKLPIWFMLRYCYGHLNIRLKLCFYLSFTNFPFSEARLSLFMLWNVS